MKMLLIAAAAAALLAPGLASAADLTGGWKVVISVADMTFNAACSFKQAGGDLSGTCTPSDPPPAGEAAPKPSPVAGKVDGANVKFSYDINFQDMPLHLDYTGVLKSDAAMDGKLDVAGMDGTFTATRP